MYFDDVSTPDDLYSRNYMLILNYDPILSSGIWLKFHIFKGLSYVGRCGWAMIGLTIKISRA